MVAALLREVASFVEDVSDSSTHTGGEIAPGLSQHQHQSACHILAAVIAQPFDDGGCARIAHGESLARHPVKESFAGGCSIQHDIADEDVFLRREG